MQLLLSYTLTNYVVKPQSKSSSERSGVNNDNLMIAAEAVYNDEIT